MVPLVALGRGISGSSGGRERWRTTRARRITSAPEDAVLSAPSNLAAHLREKGHTAIAHERRSEPRNEKSRWEESWCAQLTMADAGGVTLQRCPLRPKSRSRPRPCWREPQICSATTAGARGAACSLRHPPHRRMVERCQTWRGRDATPGPWWWQSDVPRFTNSCGKFMGLRDEKMNNNVGLHYDEANLGSSRKTVYFQTFSGFYR